jgi:hypothetical protein
MVVLFNGFSTSPLELAKPGNPWPGHPFNQANNVNNVNGDFLNSNGQGEELEGGNLPGPIDLRLKAYVGKVADTLQDYENVLFEIGNELHFGSLAWQREIAAYLKNYQLRKPIQHPVGISSTFRLNDIPTWPVQWLGASNNWPLYSDIRMLDFVIPGPNGRSLWNSISNPGLPPAGVGAFVDTDHVAGLTSVDTFWRGFTRGWQVLMLDDPDNPNQNHREPRRLALGDHIQFAARMRSTTARPQLGGTQPCSSGFCLFDGREVYLVYNPNRTAVTVVLDPRDYEYEWFDLDTRTIVETGTMTANSGPNVFLVPSAVSSTSVLFVSAVTRSNSEPELVIRPSSGSFPASGDLEIEFRDLDGLGDLFTFQIAIRQNGLRYVLGTSELLQFNYSLINSNTAGMSYSGFGYFANLLATVAPFQLEVTATDRAGHIVIVERWFNL